METNQQKLKICVFGTGSFGTALATAAARNGHEVVIVGRSEETVNEINNSHTNSKYFPKEIILPTNLRASKNLEEIRDCNLIIHAIPVQVSIESMERYREYIPDGLPYIIASKGILLKQKKFFSQVWDEVFPPERKITHMVLSGPSFAIEIMKGFPTLVSLGCKSIETARVVQVALSNETFRIYTTDDVMGVEIGGALKNVVAIMAGFIEGIGYRFNTLSGAVTRGVFEISLFSKFYGGRAETLNGLSGIGDIMLSALGDLSRNKKVGLALARGETIEDIISKALEVAEGIPTLKVLHELVTENNLHMPLCEAIYRVAYEKLPMDEARKLVMLRQLEHENELDLFLLQK
jgi:glycerol-3-phosphate dehydrogenase (NAD(P)+)